MPIASINPATGERIKTFDELSESEVNDKLQQAADAFREYRLTTFDDRARKMLRAAEILEADKKRFAETMTLEMGKPIRAAIAEAEKCAWVCRYYAENAERFLADEVVQTNATRSYIHYQPLGPVLAIMPWNFPFWQVFRFAAPALMAGNVGLLKHSSNVPACALSIEDIFRDAGFPTGAFQTLLIGSDKVKRVIQDDRIKAVTLTGSEPAGCQVASEAGKVAYAGNELKGYGNLILIRHDNGWVSAYAHNEQLLVKRDDQVQRGQVIAKAGKTGSVDQPQLHFELRQGSKPVDPMPHLEKN